MHVIRARNVCEALPAGLDWLLANGQREESRAGPVIVAPCPVTTVYERPMERVLTNPLRDANPFFHLAEAMWMLAGRRDAAFLDNFVRDFGARFAEADGVVHGAYGRRWRRTFGFDQLDACVERLAANPSDRQCVIAMWDATLPHEGHYAQDRESSREEFGEGDLLRAVRDRPCNTHAYLRVREEPTIRGGDRTSDPVLDLTVCCRSNDILWGAYGANAVHFSVLQEYLAARLGVAVGAYTQVSNNYHAYVDAVRRLAERATTQPLGHALRDDRYRGGALRPLPLVDKAQTFDHEVVWLLGLYESLGEGPPDASAHALVDGLQNAFLAHTVWPALMAHAAWRGHPHGAPWSPDERRRWAQWVNRIAAPDWEAACEEWCLRRMG